MIIPKLSEKVNKFTEKKKKAVVIGNKLIATKDKKLIKRGYRMVECSTELNFNYCPECGETHITKTNLCRDRLCPVCSWRLSLKRYRVMLQMLEMIDVTQYDAAFLTLTVRNCQAADLAATVKAMSRAFSNITKLKIWRPVLGFAKSVEVTFNDSTRTMHPHLHILLLMEKGSYNHQLMPAVKDAWQHQLQISYRPIIDLREVRDYNDGQDITAAVLETFKYAVKSKDLEEMPMKEFKLFAQQINGLRLISFGGVLKVIKSMIAADLENLTEEEKEVISCKNCGSELQQRLYKWSFGQAYYQLLKIDNTVVSNEVE